MSVLGKTWKVLNTNPNASLLETLLENRGVSAHQDAQHFLYPDRERDFHDPFLMKDMERAVARIGEAIEKKERIMIFGDYDVDGITGAAILMRALTKLGATVSCRLPHRITDGYGLRNKFLDEFKKINVGLVITVDNGISCAKEVDYANGLGIDVIISDHHTVPEILPKAYAILHPKVVDCGYPFYELTGAGVALKIAQALFMRHKGHTSDEEVTIEINHLMDLAAMGTIADLGELRGENRYIVKEGLRILENTRWPGLSRLKQSAGIKGKIDTHDIGFLLCPRINAAGRISDPTHALKLLIHDSDEQTTQLAGMLDDLNKRRQKLMEELTSVADGLATLEEDSPAIVISHPTFHGGIIGLLASRMVDRYGRPAIVMDDRGDVLVGSCRSIEGVSMVAALTSARQHLTAFGGHAMAAGFEVSKPKLEAFSKAVKKYVGAQMKSGLPAPTLSIERELRREEISHETVKLLKLFEPFGVGNASPLFLCTGLAIRSYDFIGKDKKHIKIRAEGNDGEIECVAFKMGAHIQKLAGAKEFDAVCSLEENTWNGRTRLQLNVVDFRTKVV